MSTLYRGQWSDTCELRHFKQAESLFPALKAEELLHRAEEFALADMAKARQAQLTKAREQAVISAVDWED